MAGIQKVSVALAGEQVAALETGEYALRVKSSAKPFRDWQFKRELCQEDVKCLRQLWDDGRASGPAEPFDVERTIAAAKVRFKETGAK